MILWSSMDLSTPMRNDGERLTTNRRFTFRAMPQFPPRSVKLLPTLPQTAQPGEQLFLVQVAHGCRLRHLAYPKD